MQSCAFVLRDMHVVLCLCLCILLCVSVILKRRFRHRNDEISGIMPCRHGWHGSVLPSYNYGCVCVSMYVCVCTATCVCIDVYVCVYTYVHTYVCICPHICDAAEQMNTRTHTHTHTHINRHRPTKLLRSEGQATYSCRLRF
jgi:hypothetical protein